MFMFSDVVYLLLLVALINNTTGRRITSENTLENVFEDQCGNLAKSRKLCPNLPSTCCCVMADTVVTLQPRLNSSVEMQWKYRIFCTNIIRIPSFSSKPSQLILKKTMISQLDSSSFNNSQVAGLTYFKITDDRSLHTIDSHTFSSMKDLRKIYMDSVENLTTISESAFTGLPNLKEIILKGTGLQYIQGFSGFGNTPGVFTTITISHNPQLSKIQTNAFQELSERITLIKISWNPSLLVVEDYAFNSSNVNILVLDDNSALSMFSPLAFEGTNSLNKLSFENTPVRALPTAGLQQLRTLIAQGVPNMVHFPSSSQLPSLQEAVLTYPYHCCALNMDKEYGFGEVFQNENQERPKQYDCDTGKEIVPEKDTWSTKPLTSLKTSSVEYLSDESYVGERLIDISNDTTSFFFSGDYEDNAYEEEPDTELTYHTAKDKYDMYTDGSSSSGSSFSDDTTILDEESWASATTAPQRKYVMHVCYKDANGKLRKLVHQDTLQCSPGADLFSPCENLLGDKALVTMSWMVSGLAVLGNFFVVFMLLAITLDRSRAQQRHLSVPKFLILNLAIGDFCMGLYILALSAMDGKSSEQYYNFGVEWQTGGGCDVVGFLSIFASQLSVYTLSVISLERWYAIRYAIQLDKRLTLKCGRIVMLVGWIICILLASLPLCGINSYQQTAICLPMDIKHFSGKAYVALLLSLDIIAFIVVVGSYLWMYTIVRSANGLRMKLPDFIRLQQKKTSVDLNKPKRKKGDGCFGAMDNRTADARVAKRMAVLVFTDFACFFPICLFSLFALAGLPLVSMSTAKIVLVTCYPFNACCNPFLYAILTKSFRNEVKAFIKSHKASCWNCDDRHRILSKRLDKRSEVGSRQEERRKTIQLYVEGDAESPQGDPAYMPLEPRSNSCGAKSTFVKSKSGAYSSFYYSSSRTDSLPGSATKSKSGAIHHSPKRKSRSTASSSSFVISPTTSEESFPKRLAWITIVSRLGISIFKRKNTFAVKRKETELMQHSFETQTTAATGATTLCDKTEQEPSETDPVLSKEIKGESVVNDSDDNKHCKSFL